MSVRKTYSIELEAEHGWRTAVSEVSLPYIMGWYHCYCRAPGPRLAAKVVGPDGVVAQTPALDQVSIGQVAGFPAAEQFERAAGQALEMARAIRERGKRGDR